MARNPFDELEQLFDRMETQFEGRTTLGGGSVPVDVLEDDASFVVRADLPGFDAGDLDLTYSEGRLYLDAERSEAVEAEDDASYVRQERTESVERTVTIPGEVEADGIEADFDRGVLTVTLPKVDPEDSGHRIEIE